MATPGINVVGDWPGFAKLQRVLSLESAKGADACRQTGKQLAKPSGGTLDTAPVLREFLQS